MTRLAVRAKYLIKYAKHGAMDMDVSSKESGEPRPSIGLHKVAVVGTGKLGTRIAGELDQQKNRRSWPCCIPGITCIG